MEQRGATTAEQGAHSQREQRLATGAAVAGFAATSVLMALSWLFGYRDGLGAIWTQNEAPDLVVPFGITLVGAVIVARRDRNVVGWLLLFSGVWNAARSFSAEYAIAGLRAPGSLPGPQWAAWLSSWMLGLIFPAGAFLLLLLVFPNGHLLGRRWRWVAGAALVVTALATLSSLVDSTPITLRTDLSAANPIGIKGFPLTGDASSFLWPLGLILLLIAGSCPFVRYRRADGEERQQLKWFAFAVAITVVAIALVFVLTLLLPASVNNIPFNAAIILGIGVSIPAACGVAILKYRLYGIDIVISRTLVYGALAVLITGLYVGIAVGIGELVGSGGKPNLGLSILATAIVAVGFQPARARLQRIANRLVYGERATPYQVLSEFSSQVAGSYAADEVLPRMARVLDEGTGAERSIVWLRAGDVLRAAATWPPAESADVIPEIPMSNGTLPALPAGTRAVEVRHQGELLGALSVEKRRGEPLSPVEEKLLDDLAHQAGLVLKNVGLTADLQRRVEELRASRQRLVSAQDAERRKLERNLHDGAQQHLVALKVKLGLAEMLAGKDAEKAQATILQLKADADEALDTLRDLARGIYPPLLAEKGLATALQSQARKATVPVDIDAGGIGRYPQEVEATVYFCVLEALQNVQKYAGAARATVRLRDTDGALHFDVEDDGRGFDVEHVHKGAGLTNMTDRVDAIGGSVEVRSSRGRGTAVRARVPHAVAALAAATELAAATAGSNATEQHR